MKKALFLFLGLHLLPFYPVCKAMEFDLVKYKEYEKLEEKGWNGFIDGLIKDFEGLNGPGKSKKIPVDDLNTLFTHLFLDRIFVQLDRLKIDDPFWEKLEKLKGLIVDYGERSESTICTFEPYQPTLFRRSDKCTFYDFEGIFRFQISSKINGLKKRFPYCECYSKAFVLSRIKSLTEKLEEFNASSNEERKFILPFPIVHLADNFSEFLKKRKGFVEKETESSFVSAFSKHVSLFSEFVEGKKESDLSILKEGVGFFRRSLFLKDLKQAVLLAEKLRGGFENSSEKK